MSEVLEKIENEIVEFSEFEVQLAEFKGKYDGVVYDLSVPEDEKQARSDRLSIGKVVANLDRKHKELKAPLKAKTDLIDGERKRIKDDLLGVQEKIKAQIKQHEDVENSRVENHKEKIDEIVSTAEDAAHNWMDENLQSMLKYVESFKVEDFEEFSPIAATAKDNAVTSIKESVAKREAYDKEQAELEKLRTEAAEREQKDNEEKLRLEGEERAKREAEALAKKEKERVKLEAEQAEKDKQEAINARNEAEKRAKEAEENAIIQAEKAARDERDRIESERIAEELAAKKREANNAHKKKINNAVLDALVLTGMNKTQAKKAVEAIAKGQVPYTAISY